MVRERVQNPYFNKENVPKKKFASWNIEIRIIIHIVLLFVCIETFKKFQCTEGAYIILHKKVAKNIR